MNNLAQIASDYGPLAAQFGFGGILVIVILRGLELIVRALERVNHTVNGLSRAIWTDLASRPHTDQFIKDEAKRVIARMQDDSK